MSKDKKVSKDKKIFVKSWGSSGDDDKIRFFIHTSDGREFSCWLDKFHFNVMIKDESFENNFDVETTDILVLQHAVFLVANGHFKKSLEHSFDNPITEEMIDIVDAAIKVVESK